MDPVINSLVQSPLVRSMSTVPSKASSFVHGVRDNVPPFSFQKVVVKPWNNPSKTSQDQTHKFRIPQYGTLNRAYLRIKMKNNSPENDMEINEADYDSLFTINSGSATTDTQYDVTRLKTRYPWVHPSQMGKKTVQGSPFGGGGSATVAMDKVINPNSRTPVSVDYNSSSGTTISTEGSHVGKSSNAWNVINILDEMRLTTNGKLVETVYGETIPAEVIKMPAGLRDFYIRGMLGYSSGNNETGAFLEEDTGRPWDPSACHRDLRGLITASEMGEVNGPLLENQHAQFHVPVTLSSLKMLNKNYQTRFVEDLELEVRMKSLARGFNEITAQDAVSYHDVELVLIYHNWHDNIENTIRNSNYKRGVPASVYSTNWVRAASTYTVSSAGSEKISIPITSRNLATEILIVARAKSNGDKTFTGSALRACKSDYVVDLQGAFKYDLELTGSGKTIWSGSSEELKGPDSADYDLTERRLEGGDCAYGGLSRGSLRTYDRGDEYDTTYIHSSKVQTVNARVPTQTSVDYSFGDNMAIMRFGFQTTDEFYSGGIALQTISNPTLHLTPKSLSARDNDWLDRKIEFDVYVKHANLVRIDSDTGAVSRTLDV